MSGRTATRAWSLASCRIEDMPHMADGTAGGHRPGTRSGAVADDVGQILETPPGLGAAKGLGERNRRLVRVNPIRACAARFLRDGLPTKSGNSDDIERLHGSGGWLAAEPVERGVPFPRPCSNGALRSTNPLIGERVSQDVRPPASAVRRRRTQGHSVRLAQPSMAFHASGHGSAYMHMLKLQPPGPDDKMPARSTGLSTPLVTQPEPLGGKPSVGVQRFGRDGGGGRWKPMAPRHRAGYVDCEIG